jgi:hypothetical protein
MSCRIAVAVGVCVTAFLNNLEAQQPKTAKDIPPNWFDGVQWEGSQRSEQNGLITPQVGRWGIGGGPFVLPLPPDPFKTPLQTFEAWRQERWNEENPWRDELPKQKEPAPVDTRKIRVEMLRHLEGLGQFDGMQWERRRQQPSSSCISSNS